MSDTEPKPDVGLAIFVKTPGRSALKTRLAADVGRETADRFYEHALAAIAAVGRAAAAEGIVQPYWAVAEADALDDPRWAAFDRLSQGEGGLGDRIATIYDTLLGRHDAAILVGADMPHLRLATLRDVVGQIPGTDFVIAPADDGGFVLFAGRRALPADVWRSVPYSVAKTTDRLVEALPSTPLVRRPPEFDVDDGETFARLANHPSTDLLPEQIATIAFCHSRIE